jgi:NADPH-dependent glutamate synthase beta subunit-like oxidoreductase/NAD(P)H-flavin reductase
MSTPTTFNGFTFEQLFQPATLAQLDQQFLQVLQQFNPKLADNLRLYRQGQPFTPEQISELLLDCAPILEQFIAQLFEIQKDINDLKRDFLANSPIQTFKKWFVLRRARRRLSKPETLDSFEHLQDWVLTELRKVKLGAIGNLRDLATDDLELAIAYLGAHYLSDETNFSNEIERLTQWCIQAFRTLTGQAVVKNWGSFQLPRQTDPAHLVPTLTTTDGYLAGTLDTRRQRNGFALTDTRMTTRAIQNEIHYCVYCHDHHGDFCAKGFPNKKDAPEFGLKTDFFGNLLTGCPLEEKISEMHVMKREGYVIAPLALIMIDNPMCPITGHRICNDCMKACIYQKQQPVNIPQIETRVLTDVLALPCGVEIYDLLTRWNPLRQTQWLTKPYNGLKVLIFGQGPAGFTLAHHLLMEGCAVVGTDGLKIEPLSNDLITQPIRDYAQLTETLDQRIVTGFGGVAEYGITVRWDKNFLKLIYLNLLRRPYFQVFGNVRFGGTVTVEDAWQLGFDHVAIAVGAGLAQALPIENSLASGMRQANDFLMTLQLTGAAKQNSLSSLQVRLPAVIIGGGLTGIDTATEVQAYYLLQIEKIAQRYTQLIQYFGKTRVHAQLDAVSEVTLSEFLNHYAQLQAERDLAKQQNREPDVQKLLHQWGGVTVAYRRAMQESPAYTRNPEEVLKALEEGIWYAEGLEPRAARLDCYGQVESLVCQKSQRDSDGKWQVIAPEIELAARAILVATGAKPNVAYEFEHRGTFQRVGFEYQPFMEVEGQLIPAPKVSHCKSPEFGAFTSYTQHDRRVSFLGDTHPVFHGSVVKAVASAKSIYPKIIQSFGEKIQQVGEPQEYAEFRAKMHNLFTATLEAIERLSPNVVQLTVRAPQAAKKFHPGQFFRLQNFETTAPIVHHTRLQTEGMAMLATMVNPAKGLLSLIVLEQGVSSRLCATFQVGDAVALMGPTGMRTKITPHLAETVMIIGGKIAMVDIQAVGTALRQAGSRVLYVATLHEAADVYNQSLVEQATDAIVWITQGSPVTPTRSQDIAMTGEFVDVLRQYASGELGNVAIPLSQVQRVLVLGGSYLLQQIQTARETVLHEAFSPETQFVGSVFSTMQCMLKGVCAQCLQWQIDPTTGKRTKAVFACSWHNQPLEMIDIANIHDRLRQNKLQEVLNNLWLDYLFQKYPINRV